MTTTTSSTREETVAIIRAVLASQRPHLALPNIAHRHDMTVRDLEDMLKHHGYPDKTKLRDAVRRVMDMDDAQLNDEVDTAAAAKEPYVTALPLGTLFSDLTYQRELDPTRVAKMAREYDAALVGIIEVSARTDGRYAVLDGQHRLAMTRDIMFEAENPHIACRVHTGLTVDEEASLYHRLNTTRKQLTGWDRWKARRGSGDPVVQAIEKACADAGWIVDYRMKRGRTSSTAGLEKLHNLGGPGLITYVLGIVTAAWGDDSEGTARPIIEGLAHIIGCYANDLDRERLINVLAGMVPRQLNARAAAAREVHKGTLDKLAAHVMIEEYNAAERSGRLTPFLQLRRAYSPNPGTKQDASVQRAKAIREWAIKRGLIKSDRSKVTKTIREAYYAEHGGGDGGE